MRIILFYYPPEVRREEYCQFGVFLLPHSSLVNAWKILHDNCRNMILLGSQNE